MSSILSSTVAPQVFLNFRGEQLRDSFSPILINHSRLITQTRVLNSLHASNNSLTMSSILSSTEAPQVFLNYRGKQLRHTFVSHLDDAFVRNAINVFVDKNEQRGKDLKHLFVRIEQSKIALAIFSTRYGESEWCMDELVKMKKLADKRRLRVIPIFYKVKAQDVREQRGEFGDKFWTLARASSGDQIKKWKEALESISDKMGLSLKDNSSEADFVKEIVKEVLRVIAAIGLEEEEKRFQFPM